MFYLVIPARNESQYIKDTLRRLSKSLSDLPIPWQIIVADNGSTDQTDLMVDELRTTNHELREKISVINCPIIGKGAAILHAALQLPITNYQLPMKEASGTNLTTWDVGRGTWDDRLVFGFIDADLSADPDSIPGMVARILEGKADIVIASRLLVTKTTNRSWLRTLSSKLFNFTADLFLNLHVADAQCGLKIMNERGLNILRDCQEDGWFLDIEFLAKARKAGLRIIEVSVPWIEFRYPNRSSQIHHLRDGIEAIRAILRVRRSVTST